MKGFDPKFRDFPDYIIGITKEIWEDRGIATLHDYYSKDIVVRSPGRWFWATRTSSARPWQHWLSFRTGSCWART